MNTDSTSECAGLKAELPAPRKQKQTATTPLKQHSQPNGGNMLDTTTKLGTALLRETETIVRAMVDLARIRGLVK